MGWKNVRLTDDVEHTVAFGTLDLYEDKSLRIHSEPTVTDKMKFSAKTVVKNPGFFLSLAGGLIKAGMGMPSSTSTYAASQKYKDVGRTYREEKANAEETRFAISDVFLLEPYTDVPGATVCLSGENRHYTVYFPYAHDAKSFLECYLSWAEKFRSGEPAV